MGEEIRPVIRRIYESVAFDPEKGTYRVVVIRVEYPPGYYQDITVPADEYDPNKVPEYVRKWFEKYGKWTGKSV